MNVNKIAFLSASWLIVGVSALSYPSFAADIPADKFATSQPVIKSDAHDMTAQSEEQKDREVCCNHKGGMMCDKKGGMMGDQMMCDHQSGMMGSQMGGKMCDHQSGKMGGMKCDQQNGKMCGHKGGMMEGHGAGMEMGLKHLHMIMSLDLNDEQRSKINKLSDELKHNNWATKGLIMDESAKLRDLYAADKRDPSAIGKEYQKIFDLQRKMIEATITTHNRIEEILTPEQRAQLKNLHHKGESMHDHPMH